MKHLFLLRHAKSSWDYPELSDFERPLNKRGKHDAPLMAGVMIKHKVIPDIILSSPATRAAMTAKAVTEILRVPDDGLMFNNEIYEASPSRLLDIIRLIDDSLHKVLLVGHNPGLTGLANILTDHHVDNIPTAGLFGLSINIPKWKNINEKAGKFLFFETPKNNRP